MDESLNSSEVTTISNFPQDNFHLSNVKVQALILSAELYDGYSYSGALNIAKTQRDRLQYNHASLTYGEITLETLKDVFTLMATHGFREGFGGKFLDIGSGVGKLVIAGLLLHDFDACWGIEILSDLCDVSKKIELRWKTVMTRCSARRQDCTLRFVCGDATAIDWSDSDVVFLHATCFSDDLMDKIARTGEKMKPGSFFITVSKILPSEQYEVVDTIRAEASWGKCVIFIQKRQENNDVMTDLDFLYAEGIIQNRRI